jgi:hypothetical protein
MARTLRTDRQRVFRSYLRSLRRDFNELYRAAKISVLSSDVDQISLVQAIVRQRLVFYVALGSVELRLCMYGLGIGKVDVRPVLDGLEAMRNAVRILQPVGA